MRALYRKRFLRVVIKPSPAFSSRNAHGYTPDGLRNPGNLRNLRPDGAPYQQRG